VRAIGLDLGSRRIGVALSDSGGALALPYEVVTRSGDRRRDHRRIAAIVAETEAELVVVGVPYGLDGGIGPAAQTALEEIEELARAVGVPVDTYDERFTTVTAERSLSETKMKAPARRRVVDQLAAAVILQSWLDARRHEQQDDPS
jgi:putative Holliday junction resolvase